jgi:hypothetical protein
MQDIREIIHEAGLCVVGGGMPGLCAAISGARRGIKVVLMHDRPVYGGNASSECRVHICGADRHNSVKNVRETGILEEIRMENLYRNPNRNFSVWDTVLFEKILNEPNITSLLNCSCYEARMDGNVIKSVTGWQTTTQTRHVVNAEIFADCSGDAILAPLTGAEFRMGREARSEYGESIAPEAADSRTMGMTCLFQTREYDSPQPFEAPPFAQKYESCEELPYGARGHRWWQMGYWWVELGGEHNSIHDTEILRDKLVSIALGVWDHIKNHCPNRAEATNWALDWVQFLPAKRESRRYIGNHVLTQTDVEGEGKFDDVIGYGGWSMDDHHPAGFHCVKVGAPPTIFHPAPSPYGIPYRCLYSRNISNLMFAGRNASCTHAAASSTRVMGTGCTMGQALGTATALALRDGLLPADILPRVGELQQELIKDDAYLPGVRQIFPKLTIEASLSASQGDPEAVRSGINRPVGDDMNGWQCSAGDFISYTFSKPQKVNNVSIILDSALDQNVALSYHQRDDQLTSPPDVLPQEFSIEISVDGEWCELTRVSKNRDRLVRVSVEQLISGIKFKLHSTWGNKESHVHAFWVD